MLRPHFAIDAVLDIVASNLPCGITESPSNKTCRMHNVNLFSTASDQAHFLRSLSSSTMPAKKRLFDVSVSVAGICSQFSSINANEELLLQNHPRL